MCDSIGRKRYYMLPFSHMFVFVTNQRYCRLALLYGGCTGPTNTSWLICPLRGGSFRTVSPFPPISNNFEKRPIGWDSVEDKIKEIYAK